MTPQDLKQIGQLLDRKLDEKLTPLARKADLKNLATKADLEEAKKYLEKRMDDLDGKLFANLNEYKADKEEIDELKEQIENLKDRTDAI